MRESKSVTCPKCDERVTIHINDQTCSECGVNIQDLQKEKAKRVRTVLNTVRDVVTESELNLSNIRKQDDVIRVDVSGDGDLTMDNSRLSDDSYDVNAAVDRQKKVSSLVSEIKSIEEVSGVELFFGVNSDEGSRGSKYGMQPNMTNKSNSDAVFLVGTSV